ncbi:unnamed protein product [Haemonchus placei]|uniref:DoxX family protein n=1 Tax=Haemonchus placei TaxID=6290 RepID=A0A0N4WG31_HAEPC|nr:unnamed protein product [Haemonchus placei]
MMFPGAVASSELQQAAAEKVKRDIGTFVIFGFLIEAGANRFWFDFGIGISKPSFLWSYTSFI